MKLKTLISSLIPKSKAMLKLQLHILGKLKRRIDSDLIFIYDGLHPKHLYFTRHQWLKQFINKNDIVLDIASGNGCCAYNLSGKCKKVIAVDLQAPLKQFTGEPNLEFIQGDILKIVPEINEDYTFAVASHILEHLDDPAGFLKKVTAKRIAVMVPHEENWLVSAKKDLGLNWKGDRTHRRLYNRDLLQKHLIESGYEEIELMEFDGDNGIRAIAQRTDKT